MKTKIKKLFLGIAMVSAVAVFTACNNTPAELPKVTKITAYDKDNNVIPFENGDAKVDPAITYLDIKFDKEMKTSGMYYAYDYSNEYITGCGWINAYTLSFALSLNYDTTINIVLNDEQVTDKADKMQDTEGNILDKYSILFSTKQSPNADTPMNYEYNINDKIYQDWLIDLEYNEYGNPPNLQTGITIKELFLPEKLKAGDTLTINYKIYAEEDLPDINVNLIDTSAAKNYWGILADELDIPLTGTQYIASGDEDNPNYYEGVLTFHINADMTSKCTLQFTCKEFDDPENHSVQFWLPTNN